MVTIHNDQPRLDSNGDVVDAHSGTLVAHNGTYYLYGERYRNATGMDYEWILPGPNQAPKLGVYTSTDLVHWVDRGLCLPPDNSTQWIPHVFYDTTHERFVAWWAGWGVATSQDGIHFQKHGETHSRLTNWRVAGPHLLIDTDGQGYVIFDASPPHIATEESLLPSARPSGHIVSIERLTADYLASTTVNVTGFFPDTFVEGPTLFKHNNTYYATYGTCCCGCREGAGLVIFRAPTIAGPWVRQPVPLADVNCKNNNVTICPGSAFFPSPNPINNPRIPAQGFSVNAIPSSDPTAEPQLVWMANRWLQGEGNNPKCDNVCYKPVPEACTTQGQPDYRVGRDPTYWAPVEFDEQGHVLPMVWRDSFDLDIPESTENN